MTRPGWAALLCASALSWAAPALADIESTVTYTATGTVRQTNGTPVQGRGVAVQVVTIWGGSGHLENHSATTTADGVFLCSWSGSSGLLQMVTVTINGAANTVTGNSSRELHWSGGGTVSFGTWLQPWLPPLAADDLDRDGIKDDYEDHLLWKFAPKIWLHSRETRKPVNIDWIWPNVRMRYHHRLCSDDPIISTGLVTPANITEQCHQNKRLPGDGWPWEWCDHDGNCNRSDVYRSGWKGGFFLQYPNDDDHHGSSDPHDWTLYGHAYPGANNRIVLQYWQLYSYDESLGPSNHEGDWEFVAVTVDPLENAVNVLYYMHGKVVSWGAADVSWDGTHPVSYSAEGSHAQYKSYGSWPVRCDAPGFGNDVAYYDDQCDQGQVWNSWEATAYGGIVNVGERYWPRPGSNWLRYTGLWGEYGFGSLFTIKFTSGPPGPAIQDAWHEQGAVEVCNNLADDDVDGAVDEPPCNAPPDLTVTESEPAMAANAVAGPAMVSTGGTLPVRCGVNNRGGAFFNTFRVDLYLSADTILGSEDVLLSGGPVLSGMAQTSSYPPLPTSSVTVPATTPIGSYYVIAVADAGGSVSEETEDNNTLASENQVRVVPATGSETLFLQNFGSQSAQGFSPMSGTWNAAMGTYQGTATGTSSNNTVSLVATSVAKTRTEVDVFVRDWDGVNALAWGVVQRFVDSSRFLRVDATRNGETTLFRLLEQSGNQRVLGSGSYTGDASGQSSGTGKLDKGVFHVVVDDSGSYVCVSVHGQQVIRVPYSSNVSGGTHGLFVNAGNSVDFDNVYISRLPDADHDGYSTCEGDCDDGNAQASPARAESCATAFDDDCDGIVNEGCGGGGGCFAAGTAIAMADGTTRAIETVEVGDEVLSYDIESGAIVSSPVEEVFVHESSEDLLLIDGRLEVTPNHEFYVNHEWVRADSLGAEDVLTVLDAGSGSCRAIGAIEPISARGVVYNLEVGGTHNYFAGGVLVHNKQVPTEPGPPE